MKQTFAHAILEVAILRREPILPLTSTVVAHTKAKTTARCWLLKASFLIDI